MSFSIWCESYIASDLDDDDVDVEGLGLTLGSLSVLLLVEVSEPQCLVSLTLVDTSLSIFFFFAEDTSAHKKKLFIFSHVANLYFTAIPGCFLK